MTEAAFELCAFTIGLIGLTMWLALRPMKCPSCRRGLRERALPDGGLGLACARCNVTYRRTRDELVTQAAYEHGATEPPPEARVR